MKLLKQAHPLFYPVITAVTAFILQMITANTYGLFQDEYYYAACARHLTFGYVDHPAVVALITNIALLFGQSAYALHFFPALAMAGTVIVTALIALEFGGSRFAAALASLTIIDGTVFWVMFGFMSVNAFDIFIVTFAGYRFIRTLRDPSIKNWIILGIVLGIGLNTKLTMLTFGFGITAALLATSYRKDFLTLKPYVAAFIALALFTPFLIWQWMNDFPTLEFIRNATEKNLHRPLPEFFVALAVAAAPANMILALCGLLFLLWKSKEEYFRAAAIAVTVFVAVYLANNSNYYYVVPSMPLLFAAGAAAVERWTENFRQSRRNGIRFAIAAFFILSALVKLPLGIPILPIETFAKYAQTIGVAGTTRTDNIQSVTIPFYFGRRFGSEPLAHTVDSVYHTLPDSERSVCGIVATNYTLAATVDFYGADNGLPAAISGHNSYWLWGTKGYSGEVMLAVGGRTSHWERFFGSVEFITRYTLPYEAKDYGVINIFLCRNPKVPLAEFWKELRDYR